MHDTKSRILDVAEELFAERGVDRVSVRDITDAAKVNLAAVNYHFGSKEELIAAVFARRIGPVNQLRIEALDELERSAGGSGLQVEQILEAFIRPTLKVCGSNTPGSATFSRLFGRCIAEPNPELEKLLRKQFQPLIDRMDAALMKALPHLSRSEIFWRTKFMFGAFHYWLLTKDKALPPWAEGVDVEEQTRKLISFAAAGFKAS